MDEKNVSVEELAAEQAALQETKEEEIRANVISEYGFDEETDAERIDKLVADKVESNKKLSQAIGQKIKYRNDFNALKTKAVEPPKETKPIESSLKPEDVDTRVNEVLEKRDLESMDYPDDIKLEIQKISKTLGVSVKKALADPYIQFKIGEYEKTKTTENAGISRTHKSSGKQTFSFDNPPQVDLNTPEGQKEWDAWKAEAKKQGY